MTKNYVEVEDEVMEETELIENNEESEDKPSFKERVKNIGSKVKESKIAKVAIVGGAVAIGAIGTLALVGKKSDSSDDDLSDVDYELNELGNLEELAAVTE